MSTAETPLLQRHKRNESSMSPTNRQGNSTPNTYCSIAPKINNRNSILFPENEKPSLKQRLPYYIPILNWLPHYSFSVFLKDFSAGVSVASFQIPLAISFATTMAHVNPLSGLLSLSFTPMVYCITGSINQMIVGPESAISLIVGQNIDHMLKTYPEDAEYILSPLLITAALTFISGVTLFIAGLFRLGFLDNILSQVLLMGFISGVGTTMIITAFITQCKLNQLYIDVPEHYHSTFDKILFLLKYCNFDTIHIPTAVIALSSCVLLFSTKLLKKKLSGSKRTGWVFFIPEILLITVFVTFLSYHFDFKEKYDIVLVSSMFPTNKKGKNVNVIKKLKTQLWLPPLKTLFKYRYDLLHPGITLAMLGFFESATASKALGSTYDLELSSSNRELIALGSLNIIGSFIGGSLPSFGGYGRSRINALSGAQTTVSGFIMGLVTLFITVFCFNLIGYIPMCLLSSVSTLIGFTILEECPSLLKFHFRCGGYMELFLFFIVYLTTIFYSLETGITVGIVFSLIVVVKNSTKSRIEVLGRISGSNIFVNADNINSVAVDLNSPTSHNDNGAPSTDCISIDTQTHHVEEIEGCLIVKICEPLTFTNSSDMKSRLKRLEKFGSQRQHPAAPRSRHENMTRFIIFDINGMSYIDSSAALILYNMIRKYVNSGSKVFLVYQFIPIEVKNRLADSKVLELVQYDEFGSQLGDVFFKRIEDALHFVDFIEACGDAQQMTRLGNSEFSLTKVDVSVV